MEKTHAFNRGALVAVASSGVLVLGGLGFSAISDTAFAVNTKADYDRAMGWFFGTEEPTSITLNADITIKASHSVNMVNDKYNFEFTPTIDADGDGTTDEGTYPVNETPTWATKTLTITANNPADDVKKYQFNLEPPAVSNFQKPGLYEYKMSPSVTHVTPNTWKVAAPNNWRSNTDRPEYIIRLYVSNKSSGTGLCFEGYTIEEISKDSASATTPTKVKKHTLEFEHVYTGTGNLDVKLNVEGAMARKDLPFNEKITVTLPKWIQTQDDWNNYFKNNAKYSFNGGGASAEPIQFTPSANNNPATLTLTTTPQLKHDQKFSISGLPVGSTYTVKDYLSDAVNDETKLVDKESPVNKYLGNAKWWNGSAESNPTSGTAPQKEFSDTGTNNVVGKSRTFGSEIGSGVVAEIKADSNTMLITNSYKSPAPTGIALTYAPLAAIGVLAIAGIALIASGARRRRKAKQA